MKLASIAQEAIEIENRAIKAGFSKQTASDLADEYLKAKLASLNSQNSEQAPATITTNKEELPDQDPLFGTATQIGQTLQRKGFSNDRLGPQEVNKLLAHRGFQTKCKNGTWTTTKKGEALAKISYMVTKVKGDYYQGAPRIRWDLDNTVNELMNT